MEHQATRPRRSLILAGSVLFTVLVSALDGLSGYYLRLSLLSLAPVVLVSWRVGRAQGLALAVLAGIGALAAEIHGLAQGGSPAYAVWNVAISLAVFCLAAFLTSRLRLALSVSGESLGRARQLAASLEESETRLAQAQALAKIGSWEWDMATGRVIWSEEFHRLLGDPDQSLTPSLQSLTDSIKAKDRAVFTAMIEQAKTPGLTAEGDVAVGKPGGAERILFCEMHLFGSQESGKLLGVARDVTERRRLEQLRLEVEHIVRHDLRNPLVGVINVPKCLIEEGGLTPRQTELLTSVAEAGETMLRLLNMSLDMHRMERGTYILEPVAVDLADAARRAAGDLAPLARVRGVEWEVLRDGRPLDESGALIVPGNKTLCYVMLSNLFRNALEASPRGGKVAMSLEAGPNMARARITNPGVVPQEIRDKFFEKYATAGKVGGTGLGTYSARLIARTLRGEVDMRTSDAEGVTTVTVALPLR